MHLLDVNVWLALTFHTHAHHVAAQSWFDGSSGDCFFCRFTQTGFLRVANNRSAFPQAALTMEQAWELYSALRSHDRVRFVDEPEALETHWRRLTQRPQFSPKVWNDAYLAAFALSADLEFLTFDQGFAQYKDLRVTVLS